MATSQGMCKNCGSLIMFDDRDSTCECVFCNCVFPSAEAVEIFKNPEGRTFANEKFESNKDDSHHYTTRVYSTESLEKQIEREAAKKAMEKESKSKDNEFEIAAKDVKAPKKLVVLMWTAILAFVVIVVAIGVPVYNTRKNITNSIEGNFKKIYAYDNEKPQHSFQGQTCQTFNLVVDKKLSEEDAKTIFDNYCEQRSAAGKKNNDAVKAVIYCDGGIYTVTTSGVEFQEDVKVETKKK